MGGILYKTLMHAPEATKWLVEQDKKVREATQKLNTLHQKRMEQINRDRNVPPEIKVGDVVWYHHEVRAGTRKLEEYWKGPCKVLAREEEHSYVVELTP